MCENIHDQLLEPGERITREGLREEISQIVQSIHLGNRERPIGLALTHNALAPSNMARRLRGNEVVHESDYVRRVHVEDSGLVVLR